MSPRLAQRKELGFSAAAEVALAMILTWGDLRPFLHCGGGGPRSGDFRSSILPFSPLRWRYPSPTSMDG